MFLLDKQNITMIAICRPKRTVKPGMPRSK